MRFRILRYFFHSKNECAGGVVSVGLLIEKGFLSLSVKLNKKLC